MLFQNLKLNHFKNMSKGRGNKNSITTGVATRLEINFLFKMKLIEKGSRLTFPLKWTNGASISVVSDFKGQNPFLELSYHYTNHATKEKKSIEYIVRIVAVSSNLGKGQNYYFVCPASFKKCKILYQCYGSDYFKCRLAYKNRIYYQTQTESKVTNLHTRYFAVDEKIKNLRKISLSRTYKGEQTKRAIKVNELIDKRNEIDRLRNENLERFLAKFVSRIY